MILTCPECETRFNLPAHALAPDGRRVKCSRCKHTWFEEPDIEEMAEETGDDIEDIPEAIRPMPEGSSLPAINKRENVEAKLDKVESPAARRNGYLAAAALFVVSFAVLLAFYKPVVRIWPHSIALYKVFGLGPSVVGEGLVFDQVSALSSESGIQISGQIINLTPGEKAVPPVQISLESSEGKVFGQWLARLPAGHIEGENSMMFTSEYPEAVSGAAQIRLQFISEPKSGAKAGGNNQAPHPGG